MGGACSRRRVELGAELQQHEPAFSSCGGGSSSQAPANAAVAEERRDDEHIANGAETTAPFTENHAHASNVLRASKGANAALASPSEAATVRKNHAELCNIQHTSTGDDASSASSSEAALGVEEEVTMATCGAVPPSTATGATLPVSSSAANDSVVDDDEHKPTEQLIHEKLDETNSLLLHLRENLPGTRSRIENAERMKADGNVQFGNGQHELALRLYLSSLWLLKPGDPQLPTALKKSNMLSAAYLLEALELCFYRGHDLPGDPSDQVDQAPRANCNDQTATDQAHAMVETAESGSRKVIAQKYDTTGRMESEESLNSTLLEDLDRLRIGLYRNVARACNELSEWKAAIRACKFLLEGHAEDAKTLYILASAHEGEGYLSTSLDVLRQLLTLEPQNRPVRQMHAALKERRKRESTMFGGMFDKAHKGGGLYDEAQVEKERQARIDAEGALRLEDIAKLDPLRWADQICKLNSRGQNNAKQDGAEVSKSMPATSWMKHVLPKMDEIKASLPPNFQQDARQMFNNAT